MPRRYGGPLKLERRHARAADPLGRGTKAGCGSSAVDLLHGGPYAEGMRTATAGSPLHLVGCVLLPFGAGYFLSFLYRTVNAVAGDEVAHDLGLEGSDLGLSLGFTAGPLSGVTDVCSHKVFKSGTPRRSARGPRSDSQSST